MKIVLDLDGTLIDSSERMYRLFQKLVPESRLSRDEYWNLKRDKNNHRMILNGLFPDRDFEDFNRKWMNEIESNDFLEMDRCYPDTIPVLSSLKERYELILLTARQSKIRLLNEINRLGISVFFTAVLVTGGTNTKEDLIRKIGHESSDIYVSDMGEDILLGKKYGFYTCAITHGFMNEKKLQGYLPDKIVHSLTELQEYF